MHRAKPDPPTSSLMSPGITHDWHRYLPDDDSLLCVHSFICKAMILYDDLILASSFFSTQVVEEEFGGIDKIVITHRDNAHDLDKWKARFPQATR